MLPQLHKESQTHIANMVENNIKIVDAPKEGHISEQGRDVKIVDVPEEERVAIGVVCDEFDSRIIESNQQTTSLEKLESFLVSSRDPTKALQVGKDLSQKAKEKLKSFLCKNLDVFLWRHNAMVGIDLKLPHINWS